MAANLGGQVVIGARETPADLRRNIPFTFWSFGASREARELKLSPRRRDRDQKRNTSPACALMMTGSKRTGSSPSSRSSTTGGAFATPKRSSYSRK